MKAHYLSHYPAAMYTCGDQLMGTSDGRYRTGHSPARDLLRYDVTRRDVRREPSPPRLRPHTVLLGEETSSGTTALLMLITFGLLVTDEVHSALWVAGDFS